MASNINPGVSEAGGDAGVASSKPIVCFLGPVSSYTHQATVSAFPTDKFDLMPVVTIKDIFDTTQSGRATYGVVPFENSTNGSVVPTLDCFADRRGTYPDLSVCAEIYLDVHHCLVGRRNPRPSSSSPPQAEAKADLSHIKRVYSHPQALGQCTLFLNGKLRGVETVDVSSTSRAAEMVYQESAAAPNIPCESAAVSSAVAAQALGLDILARDIEDRADNTTRFFVLRRLDNDDDDVAAADKNGGGNGAAAAADVETLLCRTRASARKTAAAVEGEGERKTKSLVSFTVPHRSPGALADVLDAFRRSGLNLTSISSRPRNGPGPDPDPTTTTAAADDEGPASFQYVFFVEFEGHRHRDPGGRVRDALAGVAASARAWRWLGSWDDMLTA